VSYDVWYGRLSLSMTCPCMSRLVLSCLRLIVANLEEKKYSKMGLTKWVSASADPALSCFALLKSQCTVAGED
jgi:hypothetical protein